LVDKELFDCPPILLMQTSVVDTNSKGQGELEVLVPDGTHQGIHLRQGGGRKGGRREGEDIYINRYCNCAH
jgi:hypothetical protein